MQTLHPATGGTEEPGYLNFARFGPVSEEVVAEDRAIFHNLAIARFGSENTVIEQEQRARQALSTVTGFRPGQLSIQPDTSTGLAQVMFGMYGTVLMSQNEYPSIRYAATRAAEHLGRISVRWLETTAGPTELTVGGFDRITPGVIKQQLGDEVTAVAVSLVDYRTGALADIEGIRQVIGNRLLIVDAIQGFGVTDVPWDLVDVVAAGGYKWLRAGYGTGFLGLSDRALEQLTPVLSGYSAHSGIEPGQTEIAAPANDASAYSLGTPNPIASARLAAAVETLHEQGLQSVAETVLDRSARIIELCDEFALTVITPRDSADRAGIVTVAPEPDQLTVLTAALHNQGVTATSRGGTVRFSAHTSTTDETFDMLRAAFVAYRTALGR